VALKKGVTFKAMLDKGARDMIHPEGWGRASSRNRRARIGAEGGGVSVLPFPETPWPLISRTLSRDLYDLCEV
jgi:hypothetical protein